MGTEHYVIRGGLAGRERLRVLARVMWPTTATLLDEVGVAPGARCLDVGCGGGDVSIALAGLAPDGFVVGVDADETKLGIASSEATEAGVGNVAFLPHDVVAGGVPDAAPPGPLGSTWRDAFDLVYVRFLLTHLPDPGVALRGLVPMVKPGGTLVVEDIDCRGHFCEPPSAAFDRYVDLYSRAALARGCDPNIGPRLPSLVADAGLVDRGMRVAQPAGFDGEVRLISALTLEAVAESVLASDLATPEEIDQLIGALYDLAATDGTVVSLPRIVQAWGRRSPT